MDLEARRERRRAAVSLPAPTAGVQLNHPFQAGLTPWTILSSLIPRLLGKKNPDLAIIVLS